MLIGVLPTWPYNSSWGYGPIGGLGLVLISVLEQARSKVAAEGIEVDTVLNDNFSGTVHALVSGEASTWPADLIVLGTHGRRGVGRMMLGSSAENILRYATMVRAPKAAVTTEVAQATKATDHLILPTGSLAME